MPVLPLLIATPVLAAIAIIDIRRGIIPNRIVYPAIVLLLILSPFWNQIGVSRSFFGVDGLLGSGINSLVTGAGCFAWFAVVAGRVPSGLGGGDVKLAGAIGLLLGSPLAIWALWIGGLCGIAAILGVRCATRPKTATSIPFGPFLAAGTVVVMVRELL